MDPTTVKTMLESGGASLAHLADHFKVPLREVEAFVDEHEIKRPTCLDEQYRRITKILSAERLTRVPWEQLVFDDPELRHVNGIDTHVIDGGVNAEEILKFYQADLRCMLTNKPTTSVAAIDNNAQNFLISNLMPIDEDEGKRREYDQVLPMLIVGKEYDLQSRPNIKIGVYLLGRLDPRFGAIFRETYVDEVMEQWLLPYLKLGPREILPEGLPVSTELLALWVWRHLSTVAFLKGLARIEITLDGVSAIVTKDQYLAMVVGILQNAVQSRAMVLPSSRIVVPGQSRDPQIER